MQQREQRTMLELELTYDGVRTNITTKWIDCCLVASNDIHTTTNSYHILTGSHRRSKLR